MNEALNEEMQEMLKLGANVQVKNGGHHWIITLGATRADYWPSSERFQVTYKSPVMRGFKKMKTMLTGKEKSK